MSVRTGRSCPPRWRADWAASQPLRNTSNGREAERAASALVAGARVGKSLPVRLEGSGLSQNSVAPPRGPGPGDRPARPKGTSSLLGEAAQPGLRNSSSNYYTAMTLQTRLLCLVRIPLEPEEGQEPERDGKTS